MGIRVLSLFDGIACARAALDRAGIPVDVYYASEVDKHAVTVAQKNYPDIIEVGDVRMLKGEDFKDIDLLIGGSPCQDLSIAKSDRKGLAGEHSALFYEYLRVLSTVRPKHFVLENVASMRKTDIAAITGMLKAVRPDVYLRMIDAALVSAQLRKRLFWMSFPVMQNPADRGLCVGDILETTEGETEPQWVGRKIVKWLKPNRKNASAYLNHKVRVIGPDRKAACLSALHAGEGDSRVDGLYAMRPLARGGGLSLPKWASAVFHRLSASGCKVCPTGTRRACHAIRDIKPSETLLTWTLWRIS